MPNSQNPNLEIESELTLIGQGTRLKGEFVFDRFTRIHGDVEGKVFGLDDSLIVVGETASIHGEVDCDEIIIDGFVHGDVRARKKITVAESGSLIGDVYSPKFVVKFGAHFEGKANTTTASTDPQKKGKQSKTDDSKSIPGPGATAHASV